MRTELKSVDEEFLEMALDGEISDLRGRDFSGLDMTGGDLLGADLSGSDLSNADLSGVNFDGANLYGARLPEDWQDITDGVPSVYPGH
jgi:uncharacterized protein YjbI with pentapeptide repeats